MKITTPFLLAAALLVGLTGCSGGSSSGQPAEEAAVEVSGVAVPDVVGQAGNDARDALKEAGFDVEFDAGEETVILAGNWMVDAQAPAAGQRAGEGTEVVLTVSKPEEATEAPTDAPAPEAPAPAEPAPAAPAPVADATASGLTPGMAITVCDRYGKDQSPWGWNADFLFDGTQMIEGDTIFLKAGVTITNAYDAEGRFTVECRVSGSEDAPTIDSFDVY